MNADVSPVAQQGPVTLTLDAEGGDNAPEEIVAGALMAASRDLHILLVGRPEIVEPLLGSSDHPFIEVVPSATVITFHDEPAGAVKSMPDSSIVVGARTVAEGRSQGFISAGNTGAMLAAALLVVKRLERDPQAGHRHDAAGVGRPRAAARFRGQRGLPARASAGVRGAGLRVCPHGPGDGLSESGAAEHRRRGEQGQRTGAVGARVAGGLGSQLRRQRRGAGHTEESRRRHRDRRLHGQRGAEAPGGLRLGLLHPDQGGGQERPPGQDRRPAAEAVASRVCARPSIPKRWAAPPFWEFAVWWSSATGTRRARP